MGQRPPPRRAIEAMRNDGAAVTQAMR